MVAQDHTIPVQPEEIPVEGDPDARMVFTHSDDALRLQPVQPEDLPIEGVPNITMHVLPQDQPQSTTIMGHVSAVPLSEWKCWIPFFFLVVCFGSLALIVGLVVGLTSTPRSPEQDVLDYLAVQGISTIDSLLNTTSPQYSAATFMANYPLPPLTEKHAVSKWTETYVMAVLYYSTSGDYWTLYIGFLNEKADVCDWNWNFYFSSTNETEADSKVSSYGTGCNAKGSVNWLQIVNMDGMAGTLPVEIGLLTHIEYLELAHDGLWGTLPAEIGNLSKLVVLNLEQNSLTGNIPDTFRSLSNLSNIRITDGGLSGTIPEWIGEAWTMLTELALTNNVLTGTIPTLLSQLTSLKLLALDGNYLSGDLAAVENLVNLRYLYLESNQFEQMIDGTFLDRFSILEHLDISNNQFIGSVPVHLMELESLLVMDVSQNQLETFVDEISEGSKLEFLAIHQNPFAGDTFPSSVAYLTNLAHLDITSTAFIGTMPEWLSDLSLLRYLFMAETTFDVGTIPERFQNLQNLKDLSLKHSNRNGTIPSWFEDLDELVLLDLDNNELTGEIPYALTDMLNLQFLLLNRNQLQGSLPVEFIGGDKWLLLLLDHNNITADLSSFCGAIPVHGLTADCKSSDVGAGKPPEVNCTCCTICCNDDDPTPCNDEDYLAQFDPNWQDGYARTSLSEYVFRPN